MPIGKNSIKRAVNNGYSKVKTTAPDMENSVIVEKEEVKVEKKAVKKPATKKATTTVKKPATVKKATTPKQPAVKTSDIKKYQIGDVLPIYLL